VLGTYTAAVVIYAVVRDRSPVGLPHRFEFGGYMMEIDSLQAVLEQVKKGQARKSPWPSPNSSTA
jgi:hypothetical protein